MSTILALRERRSDGPAGRRLHPVRRPGYAVQLAAVAVLTALLRLPTLHAPVTSDEGGFLVVARDWHAGGGSLYGPHWVDRPPLLLVLYRVAALMGGLEPLRLLGCLAASATVVLVGAAAGRRLGRRPGLVAAGITGVLLASPTLGTSAANGELLSAPFVAMGVWSALEAVTAPASRRARTAAWTTGAAAAAAVLVKQNMLDVLVFATVLALVAGRRRSIGRRLRGTAGRVVGGVFGTAAGVLGLAAWWGSAPGSVLFAMYPFRVRAAGVMAYVPWDVRWARIVHLAEAVAASAAPLVLVGVVWLVLSRRVRRDHRPVALGTLALAGYAVVSVLGGGSYWTHYAVELVVPAGLAAGLLARSGARWAPAALVAVLVAGVAGWAGGFRVPVDASQRAIGTALAGSSRPGDSVVSLLGDGGIVQSSGLASPYPYLWSLPSRTLDPRLDRLENTLDGAGAPTWVVLRGPTTTAYVDARSAGEELRLHYRHVASICGRAVLLHDGVSRPTPTTTDPCLLPLQSSPLTTNGDSP